MIIIDVFVSFRASESITENHFAFFSFEANLESGLCFWIYSRLFALFGTRFDKLFVGKQVVYVLNKVAQMYKIVQNCGVWKTRIANSREQRTANSPE